MVIKESVRTNNHEELLDITRLVQNAVAKSNIKEGRATVYIPHTTAGVTINENADPSVRRDIILGFKNFGLESVPFAHMEGNSPAHIKSSLMGFSQDIIIDNGRMILGTWQGIYFCEFDGPRNRNVYIQITGQ